MTDSIALRHKSRQLLRTKKLWIVPEIIVVMLPLYLALIVSDRLGIDHFPVTGNIVILGGPLLFLGLILTLLALWMICRWREATWNDFGLRRPKSWLRTVLTSLVVALGVLGAVMMVINPVINALPNIQPRDMSRFSYLAGNLPALMINLVLMWVTAGFVEEFLWRGYLMNRLIDLQGRQTRLAWGIALLGSAIIFGLAHSYQGLAGMLKTGAIGFVFGLSYLAVGRNLWPLILSHALIDSIDFVSHYFGG